MEPGPQRGVLARRSAAAVPAADHGPDLRLRGGQRRGAAARAVVAAQLDAADDRGAQAASARSAAARSRSCGPATARSSPICASYGDEILLCVANLARTAQPVELDLSQFKGRVPVELLGRTPFPPIGDLPYLLTLTGHGFLWFRLAVRRRRAGVARGAAAAATSLPVLVLFDGWASLFRDRVVPWRMAMADKVRAQLEREVLPAFIAERRWFAGKGQGVRRVELADHVEWKPGARSWLVALTRVESADGETQSLFPAARRSPGRTATTSMLRDARAADDRQGAPAFAGRRHRRRLRRRSVLPRARRGGRRSAASCKTALGDDPVRRRRAPSPRWRVRPRDARDVDTRRAGDEQHDRRARRPAVPQELPARQRGAESGGRDRPLPDRRRVRARGADRRAASTTSATTVARRRSRSCRRT